MRPIERTLFRRFVEDTDWVLVGVVLILLVSGVLGLFSATLNFGDSAKYMTTQLVSIAIGIVGFFILLSFNYQNFKYFRPSLYVLSIILLGSVLIFGTTMRGTKGWFDLGFFSLQPVELTKIIFILVIAGYLDLKAREIRNISVLVISLLFLFGHLVLVMMQPDFSSTLSYLPISLVLLYIAGVNSEYLLSLILFGAIAVGIPLMKTFFKLQPDLLNVSPILHYLVKSTEHFFDAIIIVSIVILLIFLIWWFLIRFKINVPLLFPIIISIIIIMGSAASMVVEKSIREYQRKRLIVFLNPEIDPLGSGYNIIQSKIAIGSGRITGSGLFSGKQTQLGFLPEQHTDFIFAVLGEETGYLVSQFLIIVYFILVWRAVVIARDARDRYGSYVASGIATMFAFSGIINIGMVMGLMPTTGLPLPLLSYGGSSMVSSLCAIGLLFSIHIRRFTN
ncbi:rod shape-determining protein RodA [Elusimicrobiota bacterium]